MNLYNISQTIKTQYANPPVLDTEKYSIGRIVTILDNQREELAQFKVTETDNISIVGIIVSVR